MERKLTAILSADVQGYSRLIAEDDVATLRTLTAYLEMMHTLVHQHGGQALGSRGDMEPRQAFLWKILSPRLKPRGLIERTDMEMRFRRPRETFASQS